MTDTPAPRHEADLRPLIARLKEIQRKCESMGTRNEEFPLMRDRLSSIISRLEAGEEPSGERLAYGAIARELFPVAHLFESVGFMTVGKEIAHVERALRDLEPEDMPLTVRSAPDRSAGARPAAASPDSEGGLAPDHEESEEEARREPIPRPIVAGGAILVVAVAVALAMVFEVGPFAPRTQPTPVAPTPEPMPSPTSAIEPTPARQATQPASDRERLADAVAQARLALLHGDLDEAVKYLSIAALINRNDPSVMETATRVVDDLMRDANVAADEARWSDAAASADHARAVTAQFGLDPGRIDEAERRYAEMKRYRVVEPSETTFLRASAGKRVEVRLENGDLVIGRLVDVDGPNLVVNVDDTVGGGIVSFTDDIPLSTIHWVRIWED